MRYVISRSLGRKLGVMCLACATFVLLYEVSMFDSGEAAPQNMVDPTLPKPGSRLVFEATAYCKGTTTASGVNVRTGIAASDPSLLPVGSVINLSAHNVRYNGVYTIMDTGPRVQGRIVDLYMWSCHEALAFGRRPVEITVLRLGWNPRDSTPSLVERLFRRREAARTARTAPAATPPETSDTPVLPTDETTEAGPSRPAAPAVDPAAQAPEGPETPLAPASAAR